MRKYLLLLMIFLLIGCEDSDRNTPAQYNAKESDYRCQNFGGFSEKVCMLSIFRLAAIPTAYEGKIIGLYGYAVEIDGSFYIFASEEFYKARNFSSSIQCNEIREKACSALLAHVGKNVFVFGRFSERLTLGDVTIVPIGAIAVSKVRSGYNGSNGMEKINRDQGGGLD